VTTLGWRIAEGEVTITESQTGDRVSIEVRLPQRWNTGVGFRHRSVKLLVRVPREADLDVRTGDGSVDVEPISGKVAIFTGDGDIAAQGMRGDIRLHTGDGSIKAEGLEGRLQADTGDGHIELDSPVTVSGTVSRSDVRGKLGAGGAPLRLQTGDGPIRVARL